MKECCWPGRGRTRNLLITSRTRIQLNLWGQLVQLQSGFKADVTRPLSRVIKYIEDNSARMKYTFFHFMRRNKVIFTTNIWIFFLLYTSLLIEEMQILTINVNKKKSSSRSYIFHCSEEWKYKFYIFTSENITFLKYAFYFINNSLYFITLYIIKKTRSWPKTNVCHEKMVLIAYAKNNGLN